ncbi:TPA: ClpX C4-type zinc finger protein [Yersinia enterocolitica]
MPIKQTYKGVVFCSFCGRDNGEVRKMFAKADPVNPITICNLCVDACLELDEVEAVGDGAALGDAVNISSTDTTTTFQIDRQLFKHLLKLALNSPDFASQITGVDVDCTSTATGEVTMRLKPSVFLLRLGTALRACR